MRICTLASGSSGNSLYIESSHSKILVDAGIGPRVLKKRLESIGVKIDEIDAVIVTHEHIDHTRSIAKLPVPVYVASKTVPVWKNKVEDLNQFENHKQFTIKDLFITPFSVPHDAIDPVGFTIEFNSTKIGIVTDIGSVTGLVVERLKKSNILILESNHDMNLLYYSSYPWELKQRIKGRLGHLSNSQSSSLLNSIYHNELCHVVLAHLSEVNNCPEVALNEAAKIVDRKDNDYTKIHVAPRKSVGEVINI
ncbi:MAG: MBL fold metallo-hydrolase [Thermodesulfobacteriota bacterium]